MKKKLSPCAGHAICLSLLLTVCCAVLIVIKTFHPAFILPRLTITVLAALSIASLVLERWIFKSETAEYLETGLLAVAVFGVLTWAVGLADLSGAGKTAISGGIIYVLALLVFRSMEAQLESADVKHKGAALALSAALLLLACQCLAGIPVL